MYYLGVRKTEPATYDNYYLVWWKSKGVYFYFLKISSIVANWIENVLYRSISAAQRMWNVSFFLFRTTAVTNNTKKMSKISEYRFWFLYISFSFIFCAPNNESLRDEEAIIKISKMKNNLFVERQRRQTINNGSQQTTVNTNQKIINGSTFCLLSFTSTHTLAKHVYGIRNGSPH